MVMKRNKTREDLKKTVLSLLGHPVIKVNITDDQLDDAVNTAIKKLWRWHHDFSYESYYSVLMTSVNMEQGFFHTPDDVEAVIEVIPNRSGSGDPLFFTSSDYQITRNVFVNGVYMQPMSLVDFVAAKMRIDNMRLARGTDTLPFTFNRLEQKVILKFPYQVGQEIVLRVIQNVIPEDVPAASLYTSNLFDNETMQDLTVALAMKIIGQVLGKYEGMQLPGGQVVTGETMYNRGKADEQEIMQRMKDEACDVFYLG